MSGNFQARKSLECDFVDPVSCTVKRSGDRWFQFGSGKAFQPQGAFEAFSQRGTSALHILSRCCALDSCERRLSLLLNAVEKRIGVFRARRYERAGGGLWVL
jgi:hypothetical protein